MKRFLSFVLLACLWVGASAQQALGPGTGLVSPQINPDHTVTFRLHAPKARQVRLTGDFLPTRPVEIEMGGQKLVYDAPGVVDLKEGPGGVWEFTSAPLSGELYSYSLIVDYCNAKGHPVTFYESEGGHTWRNWRVYLTEFAQQLFK